MKEPKKETVDGWICEYGYGYAGAESGRNRVEYDGDTLSIEESCGGYMGASGRVIVPATVIKWLITEYEPYVIT